MKWIIDIDESTIIDLKNKPNRTEVDCAVLEGKPLNNIIKELKYCKLNGLWKPNYVEGFNDGIAKAIKEINK